MGSSPETTAGTPSPDAAIAEGAARPAATAVVDLGAIAHNVRRLRAAAPSAELMAVVKADAYGHGMVPVARAALDAGAGWLGVALVDEALALRGAGISAPVLAWLPVPGGPFAKAVDAGVDLSAADGRLLIEIADAARRTGRTARVHLEIDSGMGRGGCSPVEWDGLVHLAARLESDGVVRVAGVWSHLACADIPDDPSVDAQIDVFSGAVRQAEAAGLTPEVRHLANSAAILTRPATHFDLVRPGISLVGASPGRDLGSAAAFGLAPAMTLTAQIAQVKRVGAGQGVSYGHLYVTDRPTTLGLVPIGYADGLPRQSTNAGPVAVAGRRFTVAGRMCMDQFVVDLGDAEVDAGDVVTLFGSGSAGEPTVSDWADACGTIPNEILTGIGARVVRRYVGDTGG
jgi:alanine racemase